MRMIGIDAWTTYSFYNHAQDDLQRQYPLFMYMCLNTCVSLTLTLSHILTYLNPMKDMLDSYHFIAGSETTMCFSILSISASAEGLSMGSDCKQLR